MATKEPRGRPKRGEPPRPLYTKPMADEALALVDRLAQDPADPAAWVRLRFIIERSRSRALAEGSALRESARKEQRRETARRKRLRQRAEKVRAALTSSPEESEVTHSRPDTPIG